MRPKAVIIVLNHNKKDDILACLKSVSKLKYSFFEVIVVDNGSTDGSQDAIRKAFSDYHLVELPENLGAVQGRNAGIKYAEENLDYQYVLFLDDDAEVTADALSICIDWLSRHENTAIVCGKTYTHRSSTIIMSTGLKVRLSAASIYDIGSGEEDRRQFDQPLTVDACGAFAFVIRGGVLRNLTGFDEKFNPYGWEDVDLCLRARQLGFRVTYLPNAVFIHKGTRLGRPSVPGYEFCKARNFITLLRCHATSLEILSCMAWMPFRAVKMLWKFFRRGEAWLILTHLRGALIGLRQGPP